MSFNHQGSVCLRFWGMRFSVLLVTVAFAGCGSEAVRPVGAVKGAVTLDGNPVDSGTVEFYSADVAAGGTSSIGPDGTFELEGAIPVGTYQVSVGGVIPSPDDPPPPVSKIPKRYWQFSSSGLEFEVTQGANNFVISLKSK